MGFPRLQSWCEQVVRTVDRRRRSRRAHGQAHPEERQIAELLPWVRRASHLGRYGWVTAEVTDEETLAAALEWLRESYWLKAPAAVREAAFEGA